MTLVLSAPSVTGPRPGDAIAHRTWLLGPGNPHLIDSFIYEHRWSYAIDTFGSVHTNSPDGTVYLGYQPDNPNADTWTIAVVGTSLHPGWKAVFDRETPAELVLDLLNAMLNRTTR
ncbi:hypothetical protein ABH937_006707 [Kitasatospora sp. GAS1066B]